MNYNDIAVSALCFSYNHEKYIARCLDGMVNQKTNFKYEIIIHDDASTDHTQDIIMQYAEKYPDVIITILQKENLYSQKKKHLPYILPYLHGKYVALCEGDDYWDNEKKLQYQYDAMENNKCGICVGKVQCVNEDGSTNGLFFPPESMFKSGIIPDDIFLKKHFFENIYLFQTSSYFMQTDIYINRFKQEFSKYLNGDINMVFTGILNGGIYYIDKKLSCYRMNSIGSWTIRHRMSDVAKKIELMKRRELGATYFDEATGGKYHDYIRFYMIRQSWDVLRGDIKMVRNQMKKYNATIYDIYKIEGLKGGFKYLLLYICPQLLWILLNKPDMPS